MKTEQLHTHNVRKKAEKIIGACNTKRYGIICSDNVYALSLFPENSIDLVVTSPPYGKVREYKGNFKYDLHGLLDVLYPAMKEGGVICWVEGDTTEKRQKTATPFKNVLAFQEHGYNYHDHMIYMKDGFAFPAGARQKRYHNVFENIFIFSKGVPKTFNGISDRKNKYAGIEKWGDGGERQKDGSLKPRDKNKVKVTKEYGLRNNVWYIPKGFGKSTTDKIAYEHPAIYPESLAGGLIVTYSNSGDTVVDPFAGSGTTIKMARLLCRRAIGIDIVPEYCEIAEQRLADISDEDIAHHIMMSAAAHQN